MRRPTPPRYQRGYCMRPHLFEHRFCGFAGDAAAAFALRRAVTVVPDQALALYLAVVAAEAPKKAVERLLGIDRSKLLRRVRAVESRRDDSAFDAMISRHEEAMADAA